MSTCMKPALSLFVVLMAVGLAACTAGTPGPTGTPGLSDTPDLTGPSGHLISALTTFRGPYTEVGGNIVVADDCIAISGENDEPPVLVIWPAGTRLPAGAGQVIELPNGRLRIGESIATSRGTYASLAELSAHLPENSPSVPDLPGPCEAGGRVLVLSYVKDFAQQE